MSVLGRARYGQEECARAAVVDDPIPPGQHQQQRRVEKRRRLPGKPRERAVFLGESPRHLAQR